MLHKENGSVCVLTICAISVEKIPIISICFARELYSNNHNRHEKKDLSMLRQYLLRNANPFEGYRVAGTVPVPNIAERRVYDLLTCNLVRNSHLRTTLTQH